VVTCHRGALAITYAGRSADLGAGRQIAYADGALGSPVNVDPVAVMAWREGQLVFRQAPLAEVVNEVNRYRNGRIVLANEALGRRPVDVRIPIDRVDDLIAMVREAYGAKVTTLPGAIVIIS
jgi:transmembrane sensor